MKTVSTRIYKIAIIHELCPWTTYEVLHDRALLLVWISGGELIRIDVQHQIALVKRVIVATPDLFQPSKQEAAFVLHRQFPQRIQRWGRLSQ